MHEALSLWNVELWPHQLFPESARISAMQTKYRSNCRTSIPVIVLLIIHAIAGTACALSASDLTSFKARLKTIHEEVGLALPPGTLKRITLSKRGKMMKSSEVAKSLKQSRTANPTEYMRYWLNFYDELATRYDSEKTTVDPSLAAWQKKVAAGYRECYSIMHYASAVLLKSNSRSAEETSTDQELKKRMENNAAYFQALEYELRQLVLPLLRDELELRGYLADMPIHSYAEAVWQGGK
jgi:hypothetical protein